MYFCTEARAALELPGELLGAAAARGAMSRVGSGRKLWDRGFKAASEGSGGADVGPGTSSCFPITFKTPLKTPRCVQKRVGRVPCSAAAALGLTRRKPHILQTENGQKVRLAARKLALIRCFPFPRTQVPVSA